MARTATRVQRPLDAGEVAELLRGAAERGLSVRPRGGGTKLGWGRPAPEPDIELSVGGMTRVLEHNAGDLTATLEAGVPVAEAQRAFAEAGQMLALDPPESPARGAATIGGLVAAGDSGPLRSRYNAPRDLVLGVTVALTDGTVAKSGGKVIKNVAGYDLAKLLSGSFGTLGVITSLSVRLHPRPEATATALGRGVDPAVLARAAADVAHRPFEYERLDAGWGDEAGAVLVQFAGATATAQARGAADLLAAAGLDVDVAEDDDGLWEAQRNVQRAEPEGPGVVVRVSGRPTQLGDVLAIARELGGHAASRAALGLSWLRLESHASDEDAAATVAKVRARLAPSPCAVLDAPAAVRAALDPWGPADPRLLELLRRVKERFDPAAVLNPGSYVGGI